MPRDRPKKEEKIKEQLLKELANVAFSEAADLDSIKLSEKLRAMELLGKQLNPKGDSEEKEDKPFKVEIKVV